MRAAKSVRDERKAWCVRGVGGRRGIGLERLGGGVVEFEGVSSFMGSSGAALASDSDRHGSSSGMDGASGGTFDGAPSVMSANFAGSSDAVSFGGVVFSRRAPFIEPIPASNVVGAEVAGARVLLWDTVEEDDDVAAVQAQSRREKEREVLRQRVRKERREKTEKRRKDKAWIETSQSAQFKEIVRKAKRRARKKKARGD